MFGLSKKFLMSIIILLFFSNYANAAEILTPARYVYISDFETGKVLYSKNAEKPMKPASMAKIMTIFIVFQRITEGSLELNDKFLVSEKAWRKGGSRSFLEVDTKVSIDDLLHGVIVQSGNDAAIVLAEGIAGTEEAFAKEMNYWSKKLGMINTNFTNSTGWPDPNLTTTAKDLNILTSELLQRFPIDKYPNLYPIFAKKQFSFNNINQPNRNPLIFGSKGADGLKTGHTEESGYGLVGSVIRNGQRVIMVLNGMDSKKQRKTESRRLVDLIFQEFRTYEFFKKNQTVDKANVWLGTKAKVDLVLESPLKMLLSRRDRQSMKISLQWLDPVPAPISAGDQIGTLVVKIRDNITKYPLRAAYEVEALGLFNRIGAAIKYLIFGASVPQQIAQ